MTNANPSPQRRYTLEPIQQIARTQDFAKALVDEAIADCLAVAPWDPTAQRPNIFRLYFQMYWIHGSWKFPRGYVREVMLFLEGLGMPTTAMCVRHYRNSCQTLNGTHHLVEHINREALAAAEDAAFMDSQ
ncbi:hypothetical protein KUV47_09225 [Vannielia litorea]|uniref:hypothetical protein n=1 Tax=Vannielia litorea TaxID=1217970 RepID=UPI001C968E69|nr:hypothetical protein [Vannielia litorea]MBY6153390.1 hypothetical protein [Vannielia litorea]